MPALHRKSNNLTIPYCFNALKAVFLIFVCVFSLSNSIFSKALSTEESSIETTEEILSETPSLIEDTEEPTSDNHYIDPQINVNSEKHIDLPKENGKVRVILLAPVIRYNQEPNIVEASDGVLLKTDFVHINADSLRFDTKERKIEAQENVSADTFNGVIYRGSLLQYDLNSRFWEFSDVNTVFPAGFITPYITDDLIVSGKSMYGTDEQQFAEDIIITTCDLEHPHYFFKTKKADIKLNDRIIMHQNSLYVLGARIMHLPWLWSDLSNQNSMPESGFNNADGYYVTVPYKFEIDALQTGTVFLTLATRSILSGGVQYDFNTTNIKGVAGALIKPTNDEYVFQAQYEQKISNTLNLFAGYNRQINFQMYNNSDTVTTNNISARINYRNDYDYASLNFVRQFQEGRFNVDNMNSTLSFGTRLNSISSFNANLNFYSYKNLHNPANQSLWTRVSMDNRFKQFTLRINYDDFEKIDGSNTSYGGLEKRPEFLISTNTNSLKIDAINKILPTNIEVGYGSYNELPKNDYIDRYRINVNSNLVPVNFGNSRLNVNIGLWQTGYGDEDTTAMYQYNTGASITTNITKNLTNTVRWQMQDGNGYSPLRMDAFYTAHNISDSLTYQDAKGNSFTLNAGKDMARDIWQDVSLYGTYKASELFSMTHSLGYDLNNNRWRDAVSRFSFIIKGKANAKYVEMPNSHDGTNITDNSNHFLNMTLNTRYSIEASQLMQVTTGLEMNPTSKLNLRYLAGYNAVSNEFTYNQFLITYDLHCWSASVFANPMDSQYYLSLQIKAFNIPLPGFGVGAGGNVLSNFNL